MSIAFKLLLSVLSEYKGGLEKAILKNSTLQVQLNDAFCCKTHPWLAQRSVPDLHMQLSVKLVQMQCLKKH